MAVLVCLLDSGMSKLSLLSQFEQVVLVYELYEV
jgi:hypothetical protein